DVDALAAQFEVLAVGAEPGLREIGDARDLEFLELRPTAVVRQDDRLRLPADVVLIDELHAVVLAVCSKASRDRLSTLTRLFVPVCEESRRRGLWLVQCEPDLPVLTVRHAECRVRDDRDG